MPSVINSAPIILPNYAKFVFLAIGVFFCVTVCIVGKDIVLPFLFSLILAILLNPSVLFLERHGWSKGAGISFVLLIGICVIGLLILLAINQLVLFSEDIPIFISKMSHVLTDATNWFSKITSTQTKEIKAWLDTKKEELIADASKSIGKTVLTTGKMLVFVFLIPVFTFFILRYQNQLIRFIHLLFNKKQQKDVDEVIESTKKIIQSYLIGLLYEALIIGVLYAIVLFSLGIQFAFLLSLIGALINLIPYLGAIIAALLPMLVALATQSPLVALIVFIAYILIQFIDNNIIIPKLVASKVKINALISIVVVLIGGSIWGIAGMFLSIPLTAILKVISDHVPSLKPLGYLLGNDEKELKVDQKIA